jgi:oligosaccharyl transferase complex subunit OST4
MITDNQLYTLSIFLGSASMLLIVLYHFLEVNAEDDTLSSGLASDKVGVGAVKPVGLEEKS